MTRLQSVTAGDLTSHEQYNELYDAIYSGGTAQNDIVFAYEGHGHGGASLNTMYRMIEWDYPPAWLVWYYIYYDYEAGSPVPGSVAITQGTLSIDKVASVYRPPWYDDWDGTYGVQPSYASQIEIRSNFACAVITGSRQDWFASAVIGLPSSSVSGEPMRISVRIDESAGNVAFETFVSLYSTSGTASSSNTLRFTSTSSYLAKLTVPSSPQICKVAVRGLSGYSGTAYISKFFFEVPYKVF